MKRIQLGQIPTGGGAPIPSDIGLDFFFLPGRFPTQTAHFSSSSGGSGILASTRHATKGFIYFGNAGLTAFDETNVRLGINDATPNARLHIHSDTNPGVFGYPGGAANPVTTLTSSPNLGTGSWANVDDVTHDGSSTYNYADSINGGFPTIHTDTYAGVPFTSDSPRSGWILRAVIGLFDTGGGGTHDWLYRVRVTGPGPGYSDAFNSGFISMQSISGYAVDTWLTVNHALSAPEMALISASDYRLVIEFQPSSGGLRNTYARITQFHLEVDPAGSPDSTPLQRWSLAASSDVLDATYVSNGSSGYDLKLTGNNTLMVGAGGGTSGVRLLTSSTNGRVEAGASDQTNMNLVLSGNRDATGTLITSKFTTHEFTGALKWDGATSGALTHQAAASTTSYSLTWPGAQAAATQVPANDGAGVLSWAYRVPFAGYPTFGIDLGGQTNGAVVTKPGYSGVHVVRNTSVSLTGQTASIGSTALFTPSALGMFAVMAYMTCTTAGDSGDIVELRLLWNDGSAAQSIVIATLDASVSGNVASIALPFIANASAVSYSTTLTSPGAGTPAHTLYLRTLVI